MNLKFYLLFLFLFFCKMSQSTPFHLEELTQILTSQLQGPK